MSKLRQAGSDCYSKKRRCEDHLEKKFVTAFLTTKRRANRYQVECVECKYLIRALGIIKDPVIPKSYESITTRIRK
jgi:hypothetical protein